LSDSPKSPGWTTPFREQRAETSHLGASFDTKPAFDGLDRPSTTIAPGGYTTDTHYDEAGNLLALTRPGIAVEETTFDSRGLPLVRTLPDRKAQHTQYDERGVVHQYQDEEGRLTHYSTDPLGRVITTGYVGDGTSEEVRYENLTGMVRARRDRAGQWISYAYDSGGRVIEVHAGENATTTPLLVQYQYDPAGRLTLVKNK